MFSAPGEAVIGYSIEQSRVLKIDDEFIGAHGLADSGHVHEDFKYKVVGVLTKTEQL
jgi:hypothetical protein